MTAVLEVKVGDIVYSKAGRDRGSYFVVIGVEEGYVSICDGKRRKTDKPKRKKIKHTALGMGFSEFVAGKLENGEKVTNAAIRKELSRYNNSEEEGE